MMVIVNIYNMLSNNLLQIHTNSFPPLAFPHHSLFRKWVVTFKPPQFQFQFQFHCDQRKRTRSCSGHCCRCCSSPVSESELLQEARLAVSTFFQQFGVSEEESVSIASKSPCYLNMLVEGVRDLDQLSMWESDEQNLKEKVIGIATRKGDNGKVAYLESLGFTLSSSMNVARYLSAETLPSLIHKVTSMKQLFFSATPSDDDDFLIKNIRRMMVHLSIPIDEDLQHTLSFFGKVEARRGGLNMLASKDAAFHYLIESFPRLLLLSVNNHMMRIVEFLENIGIPRFRIPYIILAFPPILLWNVQLLKTRLLALKEIDVVDKDYTKLLVKYPWVLSTSIQENYKEVVAFFYAEKVPKILIDRAIKSQPHLLACSTSKLKLMVDQFAELGVKSKRLDQVISKSPQLLLLNPKDFLQFYEAFLVERLIWIRLVWILISRLSLPMLQWLAVKFFGGYLGVPFSGNHWAISFSDPVLNKISKHLDNRNSAFTHEVVLFFENMGFDQETIGRILARCPEIFAASINKTLQRKIEFLSGIGVSKTYLPGVVRKYPELLVSDTDRTLLHRMMYLMKLGLSEKDIAFMVRSFSPLLGYSIEKVLRPKIEFLVNSMERPVRDVVSYPRYFSYSLEKKIKPRYWVLKGGNIECSLKDMLGKNDEEFAAEFMGVGRMLVTPLSSHNRL